MGELDGRTELEGREERGGCFEGTDMCSGLAVACRQI